MGGLEVLFDTNAFIGLMNSTDEFVENAPSFERIAVAFATVGELHTGVYKSARIAGNMNRLHEALQQTRIVYPDFETARRFGELDPLLRSKGRRTPPNDLWIAAIALQHGLPLLTRDAHFTPIPGLSLLAW